MIPAEFRSLGLPAIFSPPGSTWLTALKAVKDDEFFLDPTRMTLVCGTAGFDGTSSRTCWRRSTTSSSTRPRATACCCRATSTTRAATSRYLIKVLLEISQEIEARLAEGGEAGRAAFAARVKSLMTDVPDLPNFSRFHDGYREDPKQHHARGRHAQRVLRRVRRGRLRVPAADEPEDRRAAEERARDGLGQLRDPVSARLPDHGAGAGDRRPTRSGSCASSTSRRSTATTPRAV